MSTQVTPIPITQPTASIQVTQRVSLDSAAHILQRTSDIVEYERILRDLIAAGYDINACNSALLFNAFNNNKVDVVRLLLECGAKLHDGTGLYSQHGRTVFNNSTVISKEAAVVLLEYILNLPADELATIRPHIVNTSTTRIDVFNCILTDPVYHGELTKLYLAMGVLPNTCDVPCSIAMACGRAGLFSVNTKACVQHAIEQEDLVADARCTELEQNIQIDDLTAKLAKASAIIAKLTSI